MFKYKLKDKVVVITGSSIGIGRETAYKFSKEGSKVIITYYKDKKEAIKTGEKCKKLGASDVLVINLNVMDKKSIKDVVAKIVKKFGKISILVNNAGILSWKNLDKQSENEIEYQIRTNLEGLIKMTKACLSYTEDIIINLASVAGKTAYGEFPTTAANLVFPTSSQSIPAINASLIAKEREKRFIAAISAAQV